MKTKRRPLRAITHKGVWCTLITVGALGAAACSVTKQQQSSAPEPEATGRAVEAVTQTWNQDFFDDFGSSTKTLNLSNWEAQPVWVNNEAQCYDNNYPQPGDSDYPQHKTLELSNCTNGTTCLILRAINVGHSRNCPTSYNPSTGANGCSIDNSTCFPANKDKNGSQHGSSNYVAARIISKNHKEFAQGRWTANIGFYTWTNGGAFGQASGLVNMFPAWWVLGSHNNEVPVQESDENVCWPVVGSGEIDILEHYGTGSNPNTFTGRGVWNNPAGSCNSGDWSTYQVSMTADMSQFHQYQMENNGSDLIYRIDGTEVARNSGIGGNYPETMFAILNYALQGGMDGNTKEYAMQVDWVKHESLVNQVSARNLTARLEAEGNDFLYHQSTSGTYQACAATSGSCSVQDLGWTTANDSVAWLVNVPSTSTYSLTTNSAVNAASTTLAVYSGSSLPSSGQSCSAHGMTLLTNMTLTPATQGWQAWQNYTSNNFSLTAGTQALCIQFTGSPQNLDWVNVNPSARSISGHLQAENNDFLFHQNSSGGPYENCAATAGVCEVQDLGWITAGTGSAGDSVGWMVQIPSPGGSYTVTTNNAVNNGGTAGSLAVYTGATLPSGQSCSAAGMTQVATISAANTGGWQAWQNNTSGSFNLSTGSTALCIQVTGGAQNLDWAYLSGTAAADTTAPSVPSGLAAGTTTASTIALSWSTSTDPDSAVAGYYVYRSTTSGGTYTKVGTVNATSFTDSNLLASTTYYYKVAAYDPSNNLSAQSSSVSATTTSAPVPTVPSGLAMSTATTTGISLTWTASTESGGSVSGYKVYRSPTSTGTYAQVGTSTSTSFTDSGLTASTTYYYEVSAYDPSGNASANSSSFAAATAAANPTTPTVPTGLAHGTVTTSTIPLTWTASTESGGSVAGYNVYRGVMGTCTSSGCPTNPPTSYTKVGTSTTTSYTDSGLAANTAYSYEVSAYDPSNNTSANSSAFSAATAAPAADTTAPSVPGGIAKSTATSSSITLTWTASNDPDSAVAGYDVYRSTSSGGTYTKVGTANTNTYTDSGLTSNTTYYYELDAFDPSNNVSAKSGYVSAATVLTACSFSVPATASFGGACAVSSGNCNASGTGNCYDNSWDGCFTIQNTGSTSMVNPVVTYTVPASVTSISGTDTSNVPSGFTKSSTLSGTTIRSSFGGTLAAGASILIYYTTNNQTEGAATNVAVTSSTCQ
jgi:fibronectin type 3 domain-containing protein